jgi:hypothetical protein
MTMENNKDLGREDVLIHLFEVLSEDQDVETSMLTKSLPKAAS